MSIRLDEGILCLSSRRRRDPLSETIMATTTPHRKPRVAKDASASGQNRKAQDAARQSVLLENQAPVGGAESDKLRSKSKGESRDPSRSNGSLESDALKERNTKESRKRDGKQREQRVRDTFSMPTEEYQAIGELKKRCRALGIEVKKSELLRVGLASIRALPDARLAELVRPLVAARTERSSDAA